MRTFRRFTHLGAKFRIATRHYGALTAEIVKHRRILEDYIRRQPDFGTSLQPIDLLGRAPEVAVRMARAARAVGVGPMAAVAGAMAQLAAEAALSAGDREVVVDNGGDIYLRVAEPIRIQLETGEAGLKDRLGFLFEPDDTPVSVCSSSGKMGHSLSLGQCDLATIVADDAALADAAATLAGNLVTKPTDIESAMERVMSVPGLRGVLLVKDNRVGLMGKLPRLIHIRTRAYRA